MRFTESSGSLRSKVDKGALHCWTGAHLLPGTCVSECVCVGETCGRGIGSRGGIPLYKVTIIMLVHSSAVTGNAHS